jgi:hypothetical protein
MAETKQGPLAPVLKKQKLEQKEGTGWFKRIPRRILAQILSFSTIHEALEFVQTNSELLGITAEERKEIKSLSNEARRAILFRLLYMRSVFEISPEDDQTILVELLGVSKVHVRQIEVDFVTDFKQGNPAIVSLLLLQAIQHCPNLKVLTLRLALKPFVVQQVFQSQLEVVTVTSIKGQNQDSDAFKQMFANQSSLQAITWHSTGVPLDVLFGVFKRNTSTLRGLDLWYCPWFSNEGTLTRIATECPKLEWLRLFESDSKVQQVPFLVNQDQVQTLFSLCPKLLDLSLKYNHQMLRWWEEDQKMNFLTEGSETKLQLSRRDEEKYVLAWLWVALLKRPNIPKVWKSVTFGKPSNTLDHLIESGANAPLSEIQSSGIKIESFNVEQFVWGGGAHFEWRDDEEKNTIWIANKENIKRLANLLKHFQVQKVDLCGYLHLDFVQRQMTSDVETPFGSLQEWDMFQTNFPNAFDHFDCRIENENTWFINTPEDIQELFQHKSRALQSFQVQSNNQDVAEISDYVERMIRTFLDEDTRELKKLVWIFYFTGPDILQYFHDTNFPQLEHLVLGTHAPPRIDQTIYTAGDLLNLSKNLRHLDLMELVDIQDEQTVAETFAPGSRDYTGMTSSIFQEMSTRYQNLVVLRLSLPKWEFEEEEKKTQIFFPLNLPKLQTLHLQVPTDKITLPSLYFLYDHCKALEAVSITSFEYDEFSIGAASRKRLDPLAYGLPRFFEVETLEPLPIEHARSSLKMGLTPHFPSQGSLKMGLTLHFPSQGSLKEALLFDPLKEKEQDMTKKWSAFLVEEALEKIQRETLQEEVFQKVHKSAQQLLVAIEQNKDVRIPGIFSIDQKKRTIRFEFPIPLKETRQVFRDMLQKMFSNSFKIIF